MTNEPMHSHKNSFAKSRIALYQMLSLPVPKILSFLLLLSGAVLLISGATPTDPSYLKWLRGTIPLPVLEVSHLITNLTGLLLLLLARGVRLRLDAAWYGSVILLALGIVASLLKGLGWQEALFLCALLLLVLPTKGYFYRKSSLFSMSFSLSWVSMIFVILCGSVWIGIFAFESVEYDRDLWWHFSYQSDVSRFLRGELLVIITLTFYALYRLLNVARPKFPPALSMQELDEVHELTTQGEDIKGFLALLGDKHLFWSDDRKAFIMFVDTQKYWFAIGDPIGEKALFKKLLWQFHEQADLYGAKAVFYQTSQEYLSNYLDLGLVLLKMGEEAILLLEDFSLEGKKRSDLRSGRNKFNNLNYTFAVVGKKEVPDILPRLKEISDQWLNKKNAREKGISLGFFNNSYLERCRQAVVKDDQGKIMAFANIWEAEGNKEISVDLMRYDPQCPNGVMDYLFAELMLWAKSEGFQTFSFGMAPLSGLERHPLAPLWHKIGTAIFDLGEEFYNFEGLYEYKAKFGPRWFPRYLAVPVGVSIPMILITLSRLISQPIKYSSSVK